MHFRIVEHVRRGMKAQIPGKIHFPSEDALAHSPVDFVCSDEQVGTDAAGVGERSSYACLRILYLVDTATETQVDSVIYRSTECCPGPAASGSAVAREQCDRT